MSQEYINIGAVANDGLGDPIRTAFQKTNNNFSQLFSTTANIGGNLTFTATGLSVNGNITGNYFIGNGAYLTGISGGSANTGNVTFDDVNIIGTGNLKLQPDANNSGAFLDVYLTAGPDIHIAGNGENLIIGRDDGANVTVGVDGNVTIQANSSTAQSWTFSTAGELTTPDGTIMGAIEGGNTFGFYNNNANTQFLIELGPTNVWNFDGSTGDLTTPGNIYSNFNYTNALVTEQIYGQEGNIIFTADSANTELSWIISTNPSMVGANNSILFVPVSDDVHTGEIQFSGSTGTGLMTYAGPNNGILSNNFCMLATSNILLGTESSGNFGSPNTMIFDTDGDLTVSGNISAFDMVASNSVTANLFIGNFQGNVTGNFVVPGSNTQVIYNNNGNAGADVGFTYNAATKAVSVTGNVTAGNLTGNLSNGASKISILHDGNVNVGVGPFGTTVLSVNTSTGISVLGNVIASGNLLPGANITYNLGSPSQQWKSLYISGNTIFIGSTNISASGDNLTIGNNTVVVANTPMTGDVITSGYISATGNIYGGNVYTVNISASGNVLGLFLSAAGNVRGANFKTVGFLSATGNVTGGNITTPGLLTAAGNITGGNITTPGLLTTTGTFRLPRYTSEQIANIAAVEGDMVYNTTVNQIQGYQANATGSITWVSLSLSYYQ